MVNTKESTEQAAPGDLELVREFLNTWLIPNDTRVPTDLLDRYLADRDVPEDDRTRLRLLRDDLRAVVESDHASARSLDRWIEEVELRPTLVGSKLDFRHDGSWQGRFLAAVVAAARDDVFDRLKSCPDCRWVFYDHTRNRSKRWCLMNAGGPDGRACGTIAKVRRYRLRQSEAAN